MTASEQSELDEHTVRLMCSLYGYAEKEVELFIDEQSEDYHPGIASNYASISSALVDYAEAAYAMQLKET